MKNRVSWSASPVKAKKAKREYTIPEVTTQETTRFWKEPPSSFTESSDTFDDFSSALSTTNGVHSFTIASIDRRDGRLVLSSGTSRIRVEGAWQEINFQVGQRINVFSCPCCMHESVPGDNIVIDDDHNLLTVESDVISVTTFVRAFKCTNLVFFGQKVLDLNLEYQDSSAVVGSIIHSLAEIALKEYNFSLEFMVQKLKALVHDNIRLIYMSNSTEKKIISECMKHVKHLLKMRVKYIETEKKLTSFVLNLKGKVDVVTETDLIEIKTGKPSATHRAQLILYGMMHREPKNLKLYYTNTGEWVNVNLRHSEVRSIVLMRNFLSLKDCKCSTYCCLMQQMDLFCKLYWDALEREEQNRMNRVLEAFCISQANDILTVECPDCNSGYRQQCTSNEATPIERCAYKSDFIKCEEYAESMAGDVYIHIFTKNKLRLCRGRVAGVKERRVTIQLLDNIKLDTQASVFLSMDYSDILYKSIRYALLNCHSTYQRLLRHFGDPHHFLKRLQRDNVLSSKTKKEVCEGFSDTKTITPEICNEELKYGKVEMRPIWEKISKEPSPHLSRYSILEYKFKIPETLRNDFLSLNEHQRSSLFLSLNTPFFHLVHGMPGSGKTGIVTLLIRILSYYKQSVLVVSYTNLSLNNIAKRLGLHVYTANRGAIDRTARNNSGATQTKLTTSTEESKSSSCFSDFNSIDDARARLDDTKIVTATCFSFSDPVFTNRTFDFLIVDEGSQIHFPLGLLPISICKRFVVFGDHLQLKPLVFSEETLSLSLFQGLMDGSQSELRVQYRMGREIMRLPNILFYGGRMMCGVGYKGSVCYIDTGLPMYSDGLEAFFRTVDEDVVVLCYFNTQVSYLRQIIKNTVETVDRYQGSEADRVVIVFDPVVDCSVIRNRERLNVALTRARKSLLLLGDRKKMTQIPVLEQLLNLL
eukprot:jgi/Antlo1/419/907